MSEGIFKVGDICEGVNFIFFTECNGMECEILEHLQSHWVTGSETCRTGWMDGYFVRWADGHEKVVPPKHLKKRKPPAPYKEFSTTVSWDDCAWKPRELETLP